MNLKNIRIILCKLNWISLKNIKKLDYLKLFSNNFIKFV